MVAKRVLFPKETPVVKRLKTLEAKVRANTGEIKCKTFTFNGNVALTDTSVIELTAIGNGDGISQRDGNKIRIEKIDVRGVFSSIIDVNLVRSYGATVPDHSSFITTVPGGNLIDGGDVALQILKYYQNYNMYSPSTPMHFVSNRKLVVGFEGTATTNCVRNRIHLCLTNSSTAGAPAALQIKVYYRDI